MKTTFFPVFFLLASALLGCETQPDESALKADSPKISDSVPQPETEVNEVPVNTEIATLGAGCFWCIEAVLEQIEGVIDVESGYMGGTTENPTYNEVCAGRTGHAEVARITFDPEKLSYEALLAWFWQLHDPTTLNRQGNDVGTQYRSAIFYHSADQRIAAEKSKAAAAGEFDGPIVTEITETSTYYPAENYHQDYYRQNKTQGYCRAIIAPKLDKLGLEK